MLAVLRALSILTLLTFWQPVLASSPVNPPPINPPPVDSPTCKRALVTDSVAFKATRFILDRRYNVEVKGLDEIKAKGTSGVLFLPNHPGLTDPMLEMMALAPDFHPRPLIDEGQRQIPVVGKLVEIAGNKFNAVWVPNVQSKRGGAAEAIEGIIQATIEALRNGDNVLLYPSGQLMRTNREVVGSKRAVEAIVKALPNVRIVLARMEGHWGSSWGFANGKPQPATAAAKSAAALFFSGLYFVPKRDITIEYLEPADFPRTGTRAEINRYLEAFYNQSSYENVRVPYHALGR